MFYTLFWKVWMAEFYLVLFFLLGDFNAEFLIMHQHLLFHKLSIVFVLKQVVPEPTHTNPSGSSTLINLALLSAPSQILNCNVVPPLSNSDHNGFTLGVYIRWNDPGQDTPLLSGACTNTFPSLIIPLLIANLASSLDSKLCHTIISGILIILQL